MGKFKSFLGFELLQKTNNKINTYSPRMIFNLQTSINKTGDNGLATFFNHKLKNVLFILYLSSNWNQKLYETMTFKVRKFQVLYLAQKRLIFVSLMHFTLSNNVCENIKWLKTLFEILRSIFDHNSKTIEIKKKKKVLQLKYRLRPTAYFWKDHTYVKIGTVLILEKSVSGK